MDQPVYVPPSFPSQPLAPAPPPSRRGLSIGAKVGMGLVFLFAFVTMGVISRVVVRRLIVARVASQIDSADPYTLVSRGYAANPNRFSVALVRGARIGMGRNAPSAVVVFEDHAAVTDLGTALRGVIAYHGEIPTAERGPVQIEGQIRQYIHRNGAVVVEIVCVTDVSACATRDQVAERTDQAVLAHMNDTDVEGILPPDGECNPQVLHRPGHINRLMVCKLQGDVVLSVMKLNLPDTRDQTRAYLQDR